MNTAEAISVLKECHDICADRTNKLSFSRVKAIMTAIAAQKPTHKAYFYGRIFYCPSCKKSINESFIMESNRFCRSCGQALDWDI